MEIGLVLGVRARGDEMDKLPVIFPNLKKICLEMLRYTSKDLQQFAKGMSGNLVELHVSTSAGRGWNERERCFDENPKSIGLRSPDLESFRYGFLADWHEDRYEATVTDNGIISLVQGCPKVKVCDIFAPPNPFLTNLFTLSRSETGTRQPSKDWQASF